MDQDSQSIELHSARAMRTSAWSIAGLSALVAIPLIAGHSGWAIWLGAVLCYGLICFLLWRQLFGYHTMRMLLALQTENLESDKATLLRRISDSERLLAQAKRASDEAARQWEKERTESAAKLEEEKQRTAAQQAACEEIQRAVAQLNRENAELARQEADAIARRQSLQKQYSDLEKTADEIKAAYTEKADSQRHAMTELERLKADIKDLQDQRDHAQAETARLKRQIETLGMEQSNTLLRETKSKNEAAEWKARAQAAEDESRNLKAQTALQEELASRRAEIERLCQKIDDLTLQRDLAAERGRLLEQERDGLNAQLPGLQSQIDSLEQVIGELQDECRNAHQEPRHEMARHFVWKLNFFKNQEVVLNFMNEGAEVDLVEVTTEPALVCEIPGKRRLGRGAEGRVRVSATQPLPAEFLLKVRYTIYPQEAVLRIRPFDSSKIERI